MARPIPSHAQGNALYQDVDIKWDWDDLTWSPERAILLKHYTDYKSAAPVVLDRFGGNATRTYQITGHFRTAKLDGSWMLIDPDGHPFLSMGVCTVKPIQTSDPEDMEPFQRLFSGKMENWMAGASKQFSSACINTLGCWSNWSLFRKSSKPRPYTIDLAPISGYAKSRGVSYPGGASNAFPKGRQPFFDPDFAKYCDQIVREKVAPYKDDPFLLGAFSENEIVFYSKTLDVLSSAPKSDFGYKAAAAWMQKRYPDAASISDIEISDSDRNDFLQYFAGTFYRTIHESLRRQAPLVLDLGSRIDSERAEMAPVMRACGAYCDVVSINWYGTFSPNPVTLERWADWTRDKPFLVSEFYAKGDDVGFSNRGGAGLIVRTQQDRAAYYEQFALGLLQSPNCVGWHWFCYMDTSGWLAHQPYGTGNNNGHDSNKGIVDRGYQPYPPLMDAMVRVNKNVYGLKRYFGQRRLALQRAPIGTWVEKSRMSATHPPAPQEWLTLLGSDQASGALSGDMASIIRKTNYLEIGHRQGVTLLWPNPLRGGVRVRCRLRLLQAGSGAPTMVLHGGNEQEGYAFQLGTSAKVPGIVLRKGEFVRSYSHWLTTGKTYTFDVSSTFRNGFGEVRLIVDNQPKVGFRDESAIKGKAEPGFSLILPPGTRVAVEELVLLNAPI